MQVGLAKRNPTIRMMRQGNGAQAIPLLSFQEGLTRLTTTSGWLRSV